MSRKRHKPEEIVAKLRAGSTCSHPKARLLRTQWLCCADCWTGGRPRPLDPSPGPVPWTRPLDGLIRRRL